MPRKFQVCGPLKEQQWPLTSIAVSTLYISVTGLLELGLEDRGVAAWTSILLERD